MAGRPKTACSQCNFSKLRCSGEKPTCSRCLRLGRACQWIGTRRRNRGAASHQGLPELPYDSSETHVINYQNTEIPSHLVSGLVDHYFTNIYNANLLLHRPTFLQSVLDGSIEQHVLLSVCALGSRFVDQQPCLHDDAQSWAEEAGRRVFAHVDDPTEENIVTFINLALFWYSRGQWQRMMVFESNAQCTWRLLGLENGRDNGATTVKAELSRRRFWACILIKQFVTRSTSPELDIRLLEKVSLPSDDKLFEENKIPQHQFTWCDPGRTPNFYNELIKLGSLWASACRIACDDELDINIKLINIQKLDSELKVWKRLVHPDFGFGSSVLPAASITFSQRVFIGILYHMIGCAIHSSIVPLLSLGVPIEEHGYSQAISAQTALMHARSISSLLETNHPAISQAPAFVGYAAYCSSAIQIPFLWCRKEGVRQRTLDDIRKNMTVMQAISKRWRLVSRLTSFIPALYRHHQSMAYSLADEPMALDASELNRHKSIPKQARISILGHNEIVWKNGSIDNGTLFDDLGLGFLDETEDRIRPETCLRPTETRDPDNGGTFWNNHVNSEPQFHDLLQNDAVPECIDALQELEWSSSVLLTDEDWLTGFDWHGSEFITPTNLEPT
uniref:Zn(2)-C6 fungal-type domain-containing protein n=1 Tax=Bionectria ochroleuca TaxID=29856 RepID=A0A8H7N2M0_BIOOC